MPTHQQAQPREPLADASKLTEALVPLQQLNGRCLVLDDDPQVLAAWKALLEGWGVTARYATDSVQAMQPMQLHAVLLAWQQPD